MGLAVPTAKGIPSRSVVMSSSWPHALPWATTPPMEKELLESETPNDVSQATAAQMRFRQLLLSVAAALAVGAFVFVAATSASPAERAGGSGQIASSVASASDRMAFADRTDATAEEPTAATPVTAQAPVEPASEEGPTLVWQEEFDTFNSAIWKPEHSTYGDGNNELQCYRPGNVEVRDGTLVLRARTETYTCPNGSTRNVTSGMVRGAVHFEYGQRIEFRVKMNPVDPDDQRGLWPALWASGWNGGSWPNGGEFDWLEFVGTTPNRTSHGVHYADQSGEHRHTSKAVDLGEKFSDRWHTVAFDWTDDLIWYLDGSEVQRLNAASIGASGNPFSPDAQPLTEIKLNLALGGTWPGPLGPTTLDADGSTNVAIDYVRVFDL